MNECMKRDWRNRAASADAVVAPIKSGMNVFVHGAAATPTTLLEALCRRTDLDNVRLWHLHLEGHVPFAADGCGGRFRSVSLFTGGSLRSAVDQGTADFVPIFLSDIPSLFTSGQVRLDAALLQLSPPDRHGQCTLGTSVDAARAAADSGALVLAEINEQMPRTHGHSSVALSALAAFCTTDRELPKRQPAVGDAAVTDAIGMHVAALVEDRACLQLGIGAIPDAVLRRLMDRNDLGIHTEMFNDGLMKLHLAGKISNQKGLHDGRSVCTFALGSRELYDWLNENDEVAFLPVDEVNDPKIMTQNRKMVTVNGALAVDLYGQIVADTLSGKQFSGVGGGEDFVSGPAYMLGGTSLLCFASTAGEGEGRVSRILPQMPAGALITTPRHQLDIVVTEFGAVDLATMTVGERAQALASIAHPDFREELLAAAQLIK